MTILTSTSCKNIVGFNFWWFSSSEHHIFALKKDCDW